MDVAARASWALQIACSRDDLGFTDWHHAGSTLAGACALPSATGLDGRALEQAMELSAERHRRMAKRPPLPEVQGEADAELADLLTFTTTALRHGGLATSYVGLAMRAAELAGRPLQTLERTRLTRVVRSVLAAREVDRYLGAAREAPPDLPADPAAAAELLLDRAVAQLEAIQPDQIYRGARTAFVGELIHGVVHGYAVMQVLRLAPQIARPAVTRWAEQLEAQQALCDARAPQQFDELEPPPSLGYLDVLGAGFDDPEKLQFACCANELWRARGKPADWEPLIGRALAALE